MIVRRVVAAVLLALAMSGCGAHHAAEADSAAVVERLWSARGTELGDASAVTALVAEVAPGPEGSYEVRTRAERAPYGLTVAFARTDKPFEHIDFTGDAILLLGLVTVLERVRITAGADAFEMTVEEASASLGHDVKDLGRDRRKLDAFVRSQLGY